MNLAQIYQHKNIIYICFTEFQEAFNLFDNRGDGKIQLNQVRIQMKLVAGIFPLFIHSIRSVILSLLSLIFLN